MVGERIAAREAAVAWVGVVLQVGRVLQCCSPGFTAVSFLFLIDLKRLTCFPAVVNAAPLSSLSSRLRAGTTIAQAGDDVKARLTPSPLT
ncbi:hypothetical protein E2C01_054643 [Portunus trituberculatus]|uniref:Uncharacterized protein n=1 Tax=Portunus trituberculatus TaxID=210409 RepID=A0A5B7GKE9_PORTR|nr:hypothetical protein [Portunus trituberculatus]